MAHVQLSPNTPSTYSKKGVFGSGNYARRASSSSGSLNSSSTPQGIGYSPGSTTYNTTPTSPAGSGIPAFRTLRSLLPFGPNKNATPTSSSSAPNLSRSPFASFGSVRRSMTRERKSSLSSDAMTPIIAIERSNGPVADEAAIRRSVSLSRIEKPLPREPKFDNMSGSYPEDAVFSNGDGTLRSDFTLRTPSPGPPLAAELSTIIEADSSGVSRNLPDGVPVQSRAPSPRCTTSQDFLHPYRQQGSSSTKSAPRHAPQSDSVDFDISAFDLSTTEVENQVRDAMRKSTSSSHSGQEWLKAEKEVVIIDADEHPEVAERAFNPDTVDVDADLLALLSPNSGTKNSSPSSPNRTSDHRNQPPVTPTTPTFSSSPSSRLPRARQATSFLPKLRPSPSASPTAIQFSIPTPSPTTPSFSNTSTPKATPDNVDTASATEISGMDFSPSSPSPSLVSAPTSTPAAPRRTLTLPRSPGMFSQPSFRTTNLFGGRNRNSEDRTPPQSNDTPNPTRLATRTLRQVMLGSSNRSKDSPSSGDSSSFASPQQVTPLSRGSLDSRRPPTGPSLAHEIGLGRPSLDIRRTSFDSRTRPHISRGSTSPECSERGMTELDFSPSREAPFEESQYQPSFDSTVARPSFDTNSSVARLRERERERERDRTHSLRVTDTSGDRVSPIPRGPPPPPRSRKRSMSVQERITKGRFVNTMGTSENGAYGAGISRPGSSASAHAGRRTFGEDGVGNGNGSGYESVGGGAGTAGPKMEWLGPRTAKAFKAAGLLDFDRDRSKEKEQVGGDGLSRLHDRNRSNSISGAPSPSPLGASTSSNARFSSARSASEYSYNPGHARTQSRMAYSEIGGASSGVSGRRGSGSFGGSSYGGGSPYNHQGLMESPTFTVSSSSRDRDTPKSVSTAPTSLAESFGYHGRDRWEREREREREEEVRELKDKHAIEMGALLNALSDTQRTVRMLREENSQLRERVDHVSAVMQENNDLRHSFDSVERECSGLRRELASLRAIKAPGLTPSWSGSSGTSSGFRTPIPKPGNSSPLAMDSTTSFIRHDDEHEHKEEDVYNNTIIIHNSIDDQPECGSPDFEHLVNPSGDFLPPTSTPSIKRKRSDTSSIFPIPPSNMTMLLHDETTSNIDANRSNADQSQYPFTPPVSYQLPKPIAAPRAIPHSRGKHSLSQSHSPPFAYRDFSGPGHVNNKSITSTTSISPTIANFSMVTGSPGSLFLRPEHEILLGDMESLDLGVSGPESEPGRASGDDGW